MIAIEGLIFYLFGSVLLAAAIGVITIPNPVYCALLLVVSFVSAAVLWLLLGAEFLTWVLVLVYVGAVMVLFLFVVMMLDINIERLREGFWKYMPIGLVVAIALAVQIYFIVNAGVFGELAYPEPKSATVAKDYSHIKELGSVIYTDYVLAFEIAAIILLVAIVAAIMLTMRKRPETKFQEPSEQVTVKATDRVALVDIELVSAETPEAEETEETKGTEDKANGDDKGDRVDKGNLDSKQATDQKKPEEKPKEESKEEPKSEAETKSDTKEDTTAETKPDASSEAKSETKEEPKSEAKPEKKDKKKSKRKRKSRKKSKNKSEAKSDNESDTKSDTEEEKE